MRPTTSLFLTLALLLGCHSSTPTPPAIDTGNAGADTGTETGTVTLEIQRGETKESFQFENVAVGTTVESLMRSVDQIPVTIRGSGVTAFVDSIGETATSSSEGWTYEVDGKFANEGIGSTTLTPPTTITWSYGDASEVLEDEQR